MANAMVVQIEEVRMLNAPNITWRAAVIFVGADVPGTFHSDDIVFETATTLTAGQLAAAVVSAIQAKAISLGYTVAAGHSLIPSFAVQ